MNQELQQILWRELTDYTKKHGKDLGFFRFAVRTKSGAYRFLSNKEHIWKILNNLSNQTKQKYPQYTKGQIVDGFSSLVNDSHIVSHAD